MILLKVFRVYRRPAKVLTKRDGNAPIEAGEYVSTPTTIYGQRLEALADLTTG
jgi:hypothetical protein